jgi:dihydroxyacetone kinase-like predicted kinase
MGVDVIVEGGQTMNPSVRQLADAVKHAPADNVIILPNNKNIVMTAHQVSDVVNKNVYVIPTHSMPEAIALLMHVDPGMKPDEIMALYRQLRNEIMVGEITQAVRSSKIGGAEIKEGMKLVLIDGDLKWAGFASDEEALAKLLEIMSQEDVGIVTVFKGAGKEDVELEQLLSEVLGEDIEFEIHYGGQPLYPYLVLGEL